MSFYSQIGQVNLVFQIAILALIFVSLIFKKSKKFLLHGKLMLVGVILNFTSFLIVMGPSLLSLEIVKSQPLHQYSLIALAHATTGAIALIFGIFIVANWHLQSSVRSCMKRKRLMRVTIVLWTTALVLGIWFYTILYGL